MASADRLITRAVRSWAVQLFPERGPARGLGLVTLVQSVGSGLFLSSSAIFFRRVVGLSPQQVGVGLCVAGLAGLMVAVWAGRLVDRFGPRFVMISCEVAMAALFASYCAIGNFPAFVVIVSLIAICESASSSAQMTMIHDVFGPEQRVRVSAQIRSLFNLGFVIGAALAGAALMVGTRAAFDAVCLLTAAAQAASALVTLRLPRGERQAAPHAASGRARRSALRDYRFVGLTLLCGILEFYEPILVVGLPLWIITRTHASPATVPLLSLLDAVMVIVFQVAASRGAETVPGAARKLRRAGPLLAGGCLLFALSQDVPAAVAVPLLLAGTIVLVFGELSQAAGSWGLALRLPPPHMQGEYQGVFALGSGLRVTVGPLLVTALPLSEGPTGWIALAALLAAAGLVCPPLALAAAASPLESMPVSRPVLTS